MSRSLQLYIVYYRLFSDGYTRSRYCLAFSACHATQVCIRSLVKDGFALNTFDIDSSLFIQSYR